MSLYLKAERGNSRVAWFRLLALWNLSLIVSNVYAAILLPSGKYLTNNFRFYRETVVYENGTSFTYLSGPPHAKSESYLNYHPHSVSNEPGRKRERENIRFFKNTKLSNRLAIFCRFFRKCLFTAAFPAWFRSLRKRRAESLLLVTL